MNWTIKSSVIIPFNNALIIICRLFWIIFFVALSCFVAKVKNDCSGTSLQNLTILTWDQSSTKCCSRFFFSNFAVCHSSEVFELSFQIFLSSLPCMSCILHILILNNLLQTYVSLCKICKVISTGCQNGTLSENIKFDRLKT